MDYLLATAGMEAEAFKSQVLNAILFHSSVRIPRLSEGRRVAQMRNMGFSCG